MKAMMWILSLGVALCLVSGCGGRETSPRIVCDLNGVVVPTPFTFAEFAETLAAEHGEVQRTGYEQLKTRSVEVTFSVQPDGNVLAERVVALQTGEQMVPAVFFGLTNAPPKVMTVSATAPGLTPVDWGTNGAPAAPVGQ